MIYAKIYTDREENGRPLLVFEAAKREDRNELYLSHAKNVYDKQGRLRFSSPRTCVFGACLVAISPEAKALFGARLADRASCSLSRDGGDFELRGCHDDDSGYKNGMFAFLPDGDGDGKTKRVLRDGERFTVFDGVEFAPEILDSMTLCDNERLRTWALDAPVAKESLFTKED